MENTPAPRSIRTKGLYEKCCLSWKNLRWGGENQTESIMNNKIDESSKSWVKRRMVQGPRVLALDLNSI